MRLFLISIISFNLTGNRAAEASGDHKQSRYVQSGLKWFFSDSVPRANRRKLNKLWDNILCREIYKKMRFACRRISKRRKNMKNYFISVFAYRVVIAIRCKIRGTEIACGNFIVWHTIRMHNKYISAKRWIDNKNCDRH